MTAGTDTEKKASAHCRLLFTVYHQGCYKIEKTNKNPAEHRVAALPDDEAHGLGNQPKIPNSFFFW